MYIYTDILTVYARVCHRKGWMRHSGQRGNMGGGMWREKKKIRSRRDASARLGSARLRSALARLEIFKALFGYPLSREGEGERVCVTLLADTGGFERKAHKYA